MSNYVNIPKTEIMEIVSSFKGFQTYPESALQAFSNYYVKLTTGGHRHARAVSVLQDFVESSGRAPNKKEIEICNHLASKVKNKLAEVSSTLPGGTSAPWFSVRFPFYVVNGSTVTFPFPEVQLTEHFFYFYDFSKIENSLENVNQEGFVQFDSEFWVQYGVLFKKVASILRQM